MMSKTLLPFFLTVLLSLSTACGRSESVNNGQTAAASATAGAPAANATVPYDWHQAQAAYVQQGKIHFYDIATGNVRPLAEETAEVFNLSFHAPGQALFYTAVQDGFLWLKRATLGADGVNIQALHNLQLKKNDCIAETTLEHTPLRVHGDQVFMLCHFSWDSYNFDTHYIYSLADKRLERTQDYDVIEALLPDYDESDPGFSTRGSQLLFAQAVLTDKLDLQTDPEYAEEMEYFGKTLSPGRSKAAFLAVTSFGDLPHGPLCIANTDGSRQQVLSQDGSASQLRPQWLGEQLLFSDTDEQQHDADGNPTWQLWLTDADTNQPRQIARGIKAFAPIHIPNP